MALIINTNTSSPRTNTYKVCDWCGQNMTLNCFARSRSCFYKDGLLPICSSCLQKWFDAQPDWERADQICQWANVPFVPEEWEKMREASTEHLIKRYFDIFSSKEYDDFGWGDYHKKFKELKEKDEIEACLPRINEENHRKQIERWGANYDQEALDYLDGLFNGLLATQSINGSLQIDQALKICKLSYEIDCRIREGSDFDKILASYDKLVKAAEFTPKNVKNINDFESMGEVIKWLEKKGWRCKFYDDETRDIVDATIKNYQAWVQKLYINETGIGEEITRRLEALTSAAKEDDYYGTVNNENFDDFNNDGYIELMHDNDFFEADTGGLE